MALGDGIRRNIARVTSEERKRLIAAFVALNSRKYPGSPTDRQFDRPVPGGLSYWFKQDEIHARTGVHRQPIFLPWHRELLKRIEQDLRGIDPQLSLHYWDWTTDPRSQASGGTTFSLFTPELMGSEQGAVGAPWLGAGYYDPVANPARSDDPHGQDYNAAFAPRILDRTMRPGSPNSSADEQSLLTAPDFSTASGIIEDMHDRAHGFVGGAIGNPHTSFRDPFVFLLHSNVDRLFALWQLQPGHPERLDPARLYGDDLDPLTRYDGDVLTHDGRGFVADPDDIVWSIDSPMLPWSGFEFDAADSAGQRMRLAIIPIRPWAAPENAHVGHPVSPKDLSVVTPPKYDTNP